MMLPVCRHNLSHCIFAYVQSTSAKQKRTFYNINAGEKVKHHVMQNALEAIAFTCISLVSIVIEEEWDAAKWTALPLTFPFYTKFTEGTRKIIE